MPPPMSLPCTAALVGMRSFLSHRATSLLIFTFYMISLLVLEWSVPFHSTRPPVQKCAPTPYKTRLHDYRHIATKVIHDIRSVMSS